MAIAKDALSFLKELLQQPSPSGFEVPAQAVVRRRMKAVADTVTTDVHGNVIGAINERASLKVMLAGHVDEIGMMITHIDSNGYLYVATIGGWDPVQAVGQRIQVLAAKGVIPGVIGRKPIHLMEASEKSKELKIEDLWIDIGAKDKKDALKAVAVGDPAVIVPEFIELRNDLIAARGLDNRIGSWVVTEVLKYLQGKHPHVAVYAVSTVQEEIGLRGAITSTFNVHPHVGIAVDVGFASDCPTIDPKRVGDIGLNRGPILHQGPNINPVIGKLLCETARRKRIPWQMQAEPRSSGTDANAMQVVRGGCAASLVSIPNRYMHSPVEVISLRDLDNAVRLIGETILALKGNESFVPG